MPVWSHPEDRLVATCKSIVTHAANPLQASTIDHSDAIAEHTLFWKRPQKMVCQKKTIPSSCGGSYTCSKIRMLLEGCRRRSVAGEGMNCEIQLFDDDAWQSSDGSVLLALATTMAISCDAIRAQHHTLIYNLMRQRFWERVSSNKIVSLKCFAISPANSCKRVECGPVIRSRRRKKVNPIRSGRNRYCRVHCRQ